MCVGQLVTAVLQYFLWVNAQMHKWNYKKHRKAAKRYKPFLTYMKKISILTLILLASTFFGQKMTEQEWNKLASKDKRLLPKYGHLPKTKEEKKADLEFIQSALKKDTNNYLASSRFMVLGFECLNKSDLHTAMIRFNQAYLLDSSNTDIYLGYGAVYTALGNNIKASLQYQEHRESVGTGQKTTSVLPDNLKDYDYLSQFFTLMMFQDIKGAFQRLDSAIVNLQKSFQKNPKNPETSSKLSLCYYYKDDCANAWKYYYIRDALGGQPINEQYTRDLKKKCKQTK